MSAEHYYLCILAGGGCAVLLEHVGLSECVCSKYRHFSYPDLCAS